MRVPSEITRCVAFLGTHSEGHTVLRGTAFFLARPIAGVSGRSLGFAVTARHVIDGMRASGDQPFIRLNAGIIVTESSGERTLLRRWVQEEIDLGTWVAHSDRSVDAAVMPMLRFHDFDIDFIRPAMTLTREVIEQESIGLGDEIFMTGLFVNRPGENENLPIVRVGNIASMRAAVYASAEFGEMEAYLAEVRSIGGLSGSPAFVHLGSARVREGGRLVTAPTADGVFYWMGLVHGHFDGGLTSSDHVGDAFRGGARERVNMGIAIVVPADRILETFADPQLRAIEDGAARAAQERFGSGSAPP